MFGKSAYRLIFLACWMAFVPPCARAQSTTLHQTVEQALSFSPQLKALTHDKGAIEHDLKQARGRYLPSVDLLLGYGTERHSDHTTRLPDADPADTDWRPRTDASLRLTQNLYDGGETRQAVTIQKAIWDSADCNLQAATQATILNAVAAHMDVYRNHQLVVLAEKDLQVHQDIYRSLAAIDRAGAGNIADVTQCRTRLARARSILIAAENDLKTAMSNYERVVGAAPNALAFAEPPATMPDALEDAFERMEQRNFELKTLNARLMEADARVDLARSSYKPKINIEMSSSYYDQLEGDPSWQYTNDAMVVMRWNLFNGGRDREATHAALSRKYQSQSDRNGKLMELRDTLASAWATHEALGQQKQAYQEAVSAGEKTFDAYLKQYSVSRRSLLDVLNAEKEYFQSARQLVHASVDEIVAAYSILNLTGDLEVLDQPATESTTRGLSGLSQAIVLPSTQLTPATQAQPLARPSAASNDGTTQPPAGSGAPGADKSALTKQMEIGPFTNTGTLAKAKAILQRDGIDFRTLPQSVQVKYTRLLEGVYPADEGYKRLKEIKTVTDAFVLPEGDRLAIYVGSFRNPEKADQQVQRLAAKKIKATPVAADVKLKGTLLVVPSIDPLTASAIAERMAPLGTTIKTGEQRKK